MTDLEQNLTIYQGQDVAIEVTIYEEEGGATADNIVGWALEATFARPVTNAIDESLTKTTGDGITITDGANGVAQIELSDDDTEAMTAGDWEWSLWVTDAGAEAPLLIGTITVKETARSRRRAT